jgi:hypothetical protein
MQNLPQVLASIAALLGPIAKIVGLVQSRGWLAITGGLSVAVAIAIAIYALSQRRRIGSASIEIEGTSIDSINAANLRRRVNRSLTVQTAEHVATIDGADLDMVWRYVGYCRAGNETAMEFSVDSGNTLPFDQLDCYAYDLQRDPEKRHKIQPVLIGPDGISKKIAVPFLEPLAIREPFDLMLHCRMPTTYRPGVCHYTSTLSFDQDRVGRCTVRLKFIRSKPTWVRVYASDVSGRPRLMKSLHPLHEDQQGCEYRDVTENIPAQSIRIYMFKRGEISTEPSPHSVNP